MTVATSKNPELLDRLSQEQQEELSRILEDYLAALERGEPTHPAQLIAAHPHLGEALQLYLERLNFLHGAVADWGPADGAHGSSGDSPVDDLPQRELGDYRIRREIGRGGMGVVYEAEQISLGRKVALKVLPFAAVLDPKQIARFHNEAQAAGQLHHPHIVPVYAVGCERGVHFYSMQFIEGLPLDLAIHELRRSCGGSSIEPVSAPGLATTDNLPRRPATADSSSDPAPPQTAADAMAATQCGFSTARSVQTRDHIRRAAALAMQAAEALHHAHEYGIVHRDVKPSNLLVDHQGKLWITDFGLALCQGNNMTLTGDLLGTLRYMSPEQAAGRRNLVDHRTDIYSLGVTLYELLTLQYAFSGTDRHGLLARIENHEPSLPRRLNPAIPVDLETIVLKAIAKSRDDRYESAQAMADDLRRFLNGQPTLATRPSIFDRATKWAGRHRAMVGAAVTVLLLALTGTAVAALMISRAQSETEMALQTSQANYAQSQENLRQAREVVDRFGMDLASQLAELPGLESLRRSLLEQTLHYYESFVRQSQNDPALRFDLALSYSKIAALRESLGDTAAALEAYTQAIRWYTDLAGEEPQLGRLRHDLAVCHNNVGQLWLQQGRIRMARDALDRALAIQQELVTQFPNEPRFRSGLAITWSNRGGLERETNQFELAQEFLQQAVTLQQDLVRQQPADEEFRSQLAATYNELAYLLAADDPDQAARYNRLALAIHRQLVESAPGSLRRLGNLATCYNNRGSIFKHSGRTNEARTAYREALQVQQQLVQRAPAIVQFQNELAISHNNLGELLAATDPAEAERQFRHAEAIFTKLVNLVPQSPKYRACLGGVMNNLGLLWEEAGRVDQAVAAYEQAVQQQTAAFEQAPQLIQFRLLLSTTFVNYGRLLRRQNDPQAAALIALQRKELWSGAGERLYLVAAELAEAAALAPDPQAAIWADESVATLREAIAAGFDEPDQLTHNASFETLAEHPGFRELLASLEPRGRRARSTDP